LRGADAMRASALKAIFGASLLSEPIESLPKPGSRELWLLLLPVVIIDHNGRWHVASPEDENRGSDLRLDTYTDLQLLNLPESLSGTRHDDYKYFDDDEGHGQHGYVWYRQTAMFLVRAYHDLAHNNRDTTGIRESVCLGCQWQTARSRQS